MMILDSHLFHGFPCSNKIISIYTKSQLSVLLKFIVLLGNENLVTSLINYGRDLNHKYFDGLSMVTLAVKRALIGVVKVLTTSGYKGNDSIDRVLP